MPDWDAPAVISWKKKARAQQQSMFLLLGDREWDRWRSSDKKTLRLKVDYGLSYRPKNYIGVYNSTGYKESEKINHVSEVILRNAKNSRFINFACIFVFGKIWKDRFVIPVFKVKGDRNKAVFVDPEGRVYNNWQNYLESNRLPKCMYCYPRDGLYQGYENEVLVDFGTSPACNLFIQTLSALDTTAPYVSLASTAVVAASLAVPVAAPVLAVAHFVTAGAGYYNYSRSVTNLLDRKLHDQSISPADSDARNDWFGIAGTLLGVAKNGTSANINRAAASGNIASKALSIRFNVLSYGKLTMDGLGILKDFISLVDKEDKGTLTFLDVFEFSKSVLFFSNAALHPDTARGIIQSAQEEALNRYCDHLTAPEIEELFRPSGQVQGRTQQQRNANIVRMIRNIHDEQDFYESLVFENRSSSYDSD